jgi:hypothetical protein
LDERVSSQNLSHALRLAHARPDVVRTS